MKTSLSHRRAFTLIEILVVIAIIAVLAALTLSTAGFVRQKAARQLATNQLAAMEAGLEKYKQDNGDYPEGDFGNPASDEEPTSNMGLYTNLVPDDRAPYVEFQRAQLSLTPPTGGGTTNIVDPFGNKWGYVYKLVGGKYSGITNTDYGYDLWTTCGTTNRNQWVKNW
jgi:prepilin-type N-terminal cleavage/methylation domain-containing protein